MNKYFSNAFLYYLRLLAKIQIRKINPTIIGVTGSSGKTSVMEAIGMVLEDDYQVKLSHKANSQSGLPLNILGLEVKNFSIGEWIKLAILAPVKLLTNWQKYHYYVAEMGIDSPNWPANMEYLLTFLRPKVGVMTSVTGVHGEAFDHLAKSSDAEQHGQEVLEVIAEEKGKMIEALPADGWAVLNDDDRLVKKQKSRTKANIITFGSGKSADVKLVKSNWTAQGTEFVFKECNDYSLPHPKPLTIKLDGYLLPQHYGLTLGTAGAVGLTQSIPLTTSLQRIQTHFCLPPSRASLFPGINNSTILDSSYNSSPLALHDFFDMLLKLRLSEHSPLTSRPDISLIDHHAELVSTSTVDTRHPELTSESAVTLNLLQGPRGQSNIHISGSSKSIITQTSISYLTTNQPTTKPTLSFTRLIALLGDMRELGQFTQHEHEQAALVASQIFDQVFLIGPAMTQFATPIFKKHHIPTQTFTNPWQAIPALQSTLQPGDLLFVKGSQNTLLLETTIEPLLANPTDKQYLCRRGKFWENQREKLKLVNLYTNGTVSDTSF